MKTPTDVVKERVAQVLAEMLSPDALEFDVLDVGEGVARVRVRGSCGCCPASVMTLLMGVEAELHRRVPEVDYVELAP